MTIEMYNNVPTSKDMSIVLNQHTLSFIEPSTNRLLRLGYIEGGYNHSTIAMVLSDLLETLGYSDVNKHIEFLNKQKTLPVQYCRVKTDKNGLRNVRCLTMNNIEPYLQFLSTKSTSLHVRDMATGMLMKFNELLRRAYERHELITELLAELIAKELRNEEMAKRIKRKAQQMFKESPIYKLTEAETRQRKRRLTPKQH